jgi:hypothetical protein
MGEERLAVAPRSLPAALDALERDEVLLGALGAELVACSAHSSARSATLTLVP